LATTHRPPAVGHWVARKREFNKTPSIIEDVRKYGKEWRDWWIALQPEWRGTTWPLRRSGGTASEAWGETAKGGRNGFEILLVSSTWWYRLAADDRAARREWESVIEDVRWV
ncbi:hypothetical protein FA95DRAFT_1462146, partial [Auriscalpium vulgare]